MIYELAPVCTENSVGLIIQRLMSLEQRPILTYNSVPGRNQENKEDPLPTC